ncbi:MAG: hypothetical protein ABSE76_00675 [Minisyncoccia bacterium]
MLHISLVEISNRCLIGTQSSGSRVADSETNLLARDAGVMLGKHAVYVHMQLSSACLIVLCERKAHISSSLHQFSEYIVVSLISARSVPTKNDRALEIVLVE